MGALVVAGQVNAREVTKFAVTVIGAVMVTVVDALIALATGPVHPLKANPVLAVAWTDWTDPEAKKLLTPESLCHRLQEKLRWSTETACQRWLCIR